MLEMWCYFSVTILMHDTVVAVITNIKQIKHKLNNQPLPLLTGSVASIWVRAAVLPVPGAPETYMAPGEPLLRPPCRNCVMVATSASLPTSGPLLE